MPAAASIEEFQLCGDAAGIVIADIVDMCADWDPTHWFRAERSQQPFEHLTILHVGVEPQGVVVFGEDRRHAIVDRDVTSFASVVMIVHVSRAPSSPPPFQRSQRPARANGRSS